MQTTIDPVRLRGHAAPGDWTQQHADGHTQRRAFGRPPGQVLRLTIVTTFVVQGSGAAQAPPDSLRLTVRPHQMATGHVHS